MCVCAVVCVLYVCLRSHMLCSQARYGNAGVAFLARNYDKLLSVFVDDIVGSGIALVARKCA
jgi:hypothetical protein